MENPFEYAETRRESSPEFQSKSLELLRVYPEQPDQRENWIRMILEELRSDFLKAGAREMSVADLYRELKEPLMVRRDEPSKVVSLALRTSDMKVAAGEHGARPYQNSLLLNPGVTGADAIGIAMLEGKAQISGVSTIAGYTIGKDLKMQRVPEAETTHRKFVGQDRGMVRYASGIVHPEDLRFVIVRVPVRQMPKEMLTEDEEDRYFDERGKMSPQANQGAALRGYYFPHQETLDQAA